MLDKLITEVLTIADLKQLYVETFLNHTTKISKISDLSVLNAHAFGIAKILQKDLKDLAILESQMFPELSSGTYLDNAAKRAGNLSRFSSSSSSTHVLVYADPSTVYLPGVSMFASNQGVQFNIVSLTVVGDNGYAYVPVRSASEGKNTNVGALTINSLISPPDGHISCTNEYEATGGRDAENDEDFKSRISTYSQFAAVNTLLHILDNCQLIDEDILQFKKTGYSDDGKLMLSVLTCNGKTYTDEELLALENSLSSFMAISDVNDQAGVLGIKLVNTEWQQVGGSSGVDFRVDISSDYSEENVRKNIQVQMTKYFDFRFFNKPKIEWDDLLGIVKNTRGVKYVPDEYFMPHQDVVIDKYKMPRVIKFVMRDMQGNILYNNNGSVLPIYYPS